MNIPSGKEVYMNDRRIGFRLPSEIYDRMEKYAKDEYMTVSGFVRSILVREMKERGE